MRNSDKIHDYNDTDKFYLGLLMIYIRANKCSEKINSIKKLNIFFISYNLNFFKNK